MDIRKNIAELLMVHDCVIIPGFGGFIGSNLPARIDTVNNLFLPPSKSLLFNVNLKQNDGLLASSVAETASLPFARASRLVEEFAEKCRFILHHGEPVVLPGVGQLIAGAEGTIQFEQDADSNLNPFAFGLSAVTAKTFTRSVTLPQEADSTNGAAEPAGIRRSLLPAVARRAALFALPLGLAAVVTIARYDRLPADFASTADIMGAVFSRLTTSSPAPRKSAPAKPVKVLHAVTPAAATPAVVATPAPAVTKTVQDDRFAVIVGAFRYRENADKLVESLVAKGFSAAIYDQSKTGLFRVAIGTCSERDAAMELLSSARSSDFGGAWLLAK